MNSSRKKKILKILSEKALKIAEKGNYFSLASGKKSKYYLDGKIVTMNPNLLKTTANLMIDEIINQEWKPDAIGGLTLGADPLAYAISLEAKSRGIDWLPFVVRKERKNRGTGKQIEGLLKEKMNLVILEDVTTTGSSAMIAANAVKNEGHNVIGIMTMVDREEGSLSLFKNEKMSFSKLFKLSELVESVSQSH
tara:strand:+ start:792 stop:1373 length:582 start_codon:yes stop_codon:yes gene_type:complete